MSVRGSVDGADYHEYREHYCRLDGGGRNESRQHKVDQQETPKYAFRAFSEFDHEGERQTLGELGLDQHRGQHEAQDVQPHDRMS